MRIIQMIIMMTIGIVLILDNSNDNDKFLLIC